MVVGSNPTLSFRFQRNSFKETKCFLPTHSTRFNIVGSHRSREVACSASERMVANFESRVCRAVSVGHPFIHSFIHFTIILKWKRISQNVSSERVQPRARDQNVKPYIFLSNPWRPKGFFQFEIILNVLVSSFSPIWPMLRVYAHFNMLPLTVRGSTLDVGIWRL